MYREIHSYIGYSKEQAGESKRIFRKQNNAYGQPELRCLVSNHFELRHPQLLLNVLHSEKTLHYFLEL